MATHSFTFQFEELPLETTGGFEAFLTSGEAEIQYSYPDRDDWGVRNIGSIGYRRLHHTLEQHVEAQRAGKALPAYEKRLIVLDPGTPLFNMILHVLEHEWAGKVTDAVAENIEDRRAAAADDAADYRREQMMERV